MVYLVVDCLLVDLVITDEHEIIKKRELVGIQYYLHDFLNCLIADCSVR